VKVAWKGTRISPVFEELVVEIDSLFELSKIGPPPHLSKKFSFEEFKGVALFKIGASLDRPDSKSEIRESLTISFSYGKKDFS
jgi:hypothetical protein